MIVVVPSIMHSGSNTTRLDILSQFTQVNFNDEELYEYTQKTGHVTDMQMDDLIEDLDKGYYSIVPLRHPERIQESWSKRKYKRQSLSEQWSNLINVVDKYNPSYIHIDSKAVRDEELARISNDLGIALQTDWPKLNSCNFKVKGLPVVSTKYIDFYYETMNG